MIELWHHCTMDRGVGPHPHVVWAAEQVRSGRPWYVRPVMNDMALSFAAQVLREVVAAKGIDYSRIDDPGLRSSVDRMVLQNAGMSNGDISAMVRAKLGVNLRSDWVEHIRSQSASRQRKYSAMSGNDRDEVDRKIVHDWSTSERFEKFEDISRNLKRHGVLVTPDEISQIVGRFVQKKMKSVPGGASMVDFVGRLVLQGKSHDEIVEASDGAIPKHRIAAIWKYYKRLNPEVAEEVHFGPDMTFAKPGVQSEHSDAIRKMYDQGTPIEDIADRLGVSQAVVWSHLIGSASGKPKVKMRTTGDLDAAALDYAGRLPIAWRGYDPSMSELAEVEGTRPSSGERRFQRLKRQMEGLPARRSRPRTDFEAGRELVPELVERGLSDRQIAEQLSSLMMPGEEDWSTDNVRYIRENFPAQQAGPTRLLPMPMQTPIMQVASSRPSDRFVRLSQYSANAPTGQLGQPGTADPIDPQQQAAQQAQQQKEQLKRNLQMLQTLRQQEKQLQQQLAQLGTNKQQLEKTVIQQQQGAKVT